MLVDGVGDRTQARGMSSGGDEGFHITNCKLQIADYKFFFSGGIGADIEQRNL
jgi:hypothetical protein